MKLKVSCSPIKNYSVQLLWEKEEEEEREMTTKVSGWNQTRNVAVVKHEQKPFGPFMGFVDDKKNIE